MIFVAHLLVGDGKLAFLKFLMPEMTFLVHIQFHSIYECIYVASVSVVCLSINIFKLLVLLSSESDSFPYYTIYRLRFCLHYCLFGCQNNKLHWL